MNIIKKRERHEQEMEVLASVLFWIERLFLFLILVSSQLRTDLISLQLLFLILLASIFFFLCPKLTSGGLFGISGFWRFLSDRFMFLLLAVKSFRAEYIFLWPLTVCIFIANYSVYIIEYLFRSYKHHNDETLMSTDWNGIDEDIHVNKEWQKKMREFLKELREDEKKIAIEKEFLEHFINSLKTHTTKLSAALLELREDLRVDGEMMRTYRELMKRLIYSELGTLEENFCLNVDETWEVQVSRDDVVKFLGEDFCESYLVTQEIAKAAKTASDRVNLTYLATKTFIGEIQDMRWVVKEEDIEEFIELREEVWRMLVEFEDRKMEVEAIAKRAAKELSCVSMELMQAVDFWQWEEY